jgi:hypothetical protein
MTCPGYLISISNFKRIIKGVLLGFNLFKNTSLKAARGSSFQLEATNFEIKRAGHYDRFIRDDKGEEQPMT